MRSNTALGVYNHFGNNLALAIKFEDIHVYRLAIWVLYIFCRETPSHLHQETWIRIFLEWL